jgi:hypothetical protein
MVRGGPRARRSADAGHRETSSHRSVAISITDHRFDFRRGDHSSPPLLFSRSRSRDLSVRDLTPIAFTCRSPRAALVCERFDSPYVNHVRCAERPPRTTVFIHATCRT